VKTFIAISVLFSLALPTYGQEVTVEEIRSPLVGFYRQGYWHPVEVVLSAGRESANGTLQLKAGKITFVSAFEIPPGSRRTLPLQVAFFDSDPSVSVTVLAGKEKLSFPAVAQQFQKNLTCVAPDKKLVAIIEDSPDETFSYLFKDDAIATVYVACARVPTESVNFYQFDAVAVRPHEWLSLFAEQKDAIENFVRNGGVVFIPQHPLYPLPLTGKELERRGLFVANEWGLGKVISPLPEPEYEKRLRSKDPQLKDDLLRITRLSDTRLHPNSLIAPDATQLFESLPPFGSLRTRWFWILCIYVLAALLGIGCTAAGVWKARYGLSLLFLSLIISSSSFALTVPQESVIARRAAILFLHSGSRQARVTEVVSITCESAQKTVEKVPLGRSGLIKPLFSDWSDYFRSETVLEQPAPAALNVSVTPPGQLLFQIDSESHISGGIDFSLDSASQTVKVSNRTGCDLTDCLLSYQGMAFPLGAISSGQTIEATCSPASATPIPQIVSSMKESWEPEQRTRGALLSYAFHTIHDPQTTSLVGWRNNFPARTTPAEITQELWLISER